MLHALMQEHPDRAERLRVHVEALEASIEGQPAFCLQNVRTLFEAAQATIAPQLGVTFGRNSGFPDRMRSVIEKMDFSIANHPEATKIHSTITALLKGIDDIAVALAQLSNIPNMRHGGSLDWARSKVSTRRFSADCATRWSASCSMSPGGVQPQGR